MKVRELVWRYHGRPVDEPVPKYLTTPREAATVAIELLQHEPVEVFIAMFLNLRNRLLSFHTISRGSMEATVVHPREVFLSALFARASHVILAHNHPSGDPAPSKEDMLLTRRLISGGELLGIEVSDHIIVGGLRYHSFREHGCL